MGQKAHFQLVSPFLINIFDSNKRVKKTEGVLDFNVMQIQPGGTILEDT